MPKVRKLKRKKRGRKNVAKNKRIQDLYFGVMLPVWNGKPVLEPGNLFDCTCIRYWAAKYRLRHEYGESRLTTNPVSYIFGDIWGRAEYGWIVADLTESTSDMKVGLYEVYVEPNKELLLNMINECSENSAREYIREYNSKYKHKATK